VTTRDAGIPASKEKHPTRDPTAQHVRPDALPEEQIEPPGPGSNSEPRGVGAATITS